MNPEDEIFLSAYLDGELDTEQRLRVESALLDDPHLAEHLRELTAVRELVAGLPRSALTVDLSHLVVAKIAKPAAARYWPQRFPVEVRAETAALWATAATLLVSFVFTLRSMPHIAPRPFAVPPDVVAANAEPSGALNRVKPAAGVVASGASRPPSMTAAERSAPLAALLHRSEPNEAKGANGPLPLLDIVDNPSLKRVFFVVDKLGGRAVKQVEGVVRDLPALEPACGRITVSEGIAIDPKHPNEATVFALVMDDSDLNQFRSRMRETFPDSLEESEPDPSVLVQLADIGQMSILPSTASRAAAELVPPAADAPRIAAKAEDPKAHTGAVTLEDSEFRGEMVRLGPDIRSPAGSNPDDDDATAERAPRTPPPSRHATVPEVLVERPSPPATVATVSSETPSQAIVSRKHPVLVLVWVTVRENPTTAVP